MQLLHLLLAVLLPLGFVASAEEVVPKRICEEKAVLKCTLSDCTSLDACDVLMLKFAHIGSERMAAVAKRLATHETIDLLDLRDNTLGLEGALALAEALRVNKFLRHLDLRYNQIGIEGLEAVIAAISDNPASAISAMHMGENSLGDDGATILSLIHI